MHRSNHAGVLAIYSVAVLLTLSLTAAELRAQACGTTVAPGFHGGETWTLAGSPYCVTGDIQVSGHTIEPGVEVLVDGPFEIEVQTPITAIGTVSQPIIFTAKDPGVKWHGLRFQDNAGGVLTHCRIELSNDSAIRIINSFPLISHCTFSLCTNVGNGGALDIDNPSGNLILENCLITGNTATGHGGGIDALVGTGTLTLNDCIITHNVSNPANSAGSFVGGGIRIEGHLNMTGCRVENNTSNSCADNFATRTNRGGGVYMSIGDAVIKNSHIKSNISRTFNCGSFATTTAGHVQRLAFGGGLYLNSGSLSATNCIISCNTATAAHGTLGGGVYVNSGTADFVNCTIARNTTRGIDVGTATVTVMNSILYFNNSELSQLASTITVDYSDIQNGFTGIDNLAFNPVFGPVGCSRIDMTIKSFSPCIDTGNLDPSFNDACLPPSLGGVRNDMGAHGGPLGCNWGKVADITGDGPVNVTDLLKLLAGWGPCPANLFCPPDINGDEQVNVTDLLALLGDWG